MHIHYCLLTKQYFKFKVGLTYNHSLLESTEVSMRFKHITFALLNLLPISATLRYNRFLKINQQEFKFPTIDHIT